MAEPVVVPPDQAARVRIGADLGDSLFVEAGAGSGKTAELVRRIVALVVTGTAEIGSIAAITFTDKAAAELKDRIRRALEDRAGLEDQAGRQPDSEGRVGQEAAGEGGASRESDGEVAGRVRAALEGLDGAAIGTLHSFARRLLSEHPIEAGLPPKVEVSDEVTSGLDFDRRWAAYQDALLSDPALERTIVLLMASGVRPAALRALAVAFDQNWDLVQERVPAVAPEPPAVGELARGALAEVEAVCAERDHCRDGEDKLCLRLGEIAAYLGHLRSLDDEAGLLEALGPGGSPRPPSFRVGNCGKKANWNLDLEGLRAEVRKAGDGLAQVREPVAQACAQRIGVAIAGFTLASATERREAGRLVFHDLLVLARALLRDPGHGPEVRDRLHRRYTALLLDEMQDTDPIQIELAVRIAAADPESPEAGAAPWAEVGLSPGRLFVVGDPKQSIYRFRRADIATFLAARDRLGIEGGGLVRLSANFRSTTPVIDWVNHVFSSLMAEPGGAGVAASQPDYLALDPLRSPPPKGPPVSVLGRVAHDNGARADDLRAEEAKEVAATVVRALTEGWSVDDGLGGWQAARAADLAILVPARTSLGFLEDALEGAGIAYRAESSSLVYATRAVRDLLMVLRAVDDPTDHLRIVAALRTPLLACGDDDLY
ncbi:MAG: UvrD-helicase domain-containing protein, partial [Acidimicrobiales bacterium]